MPARRLPWIKFWPEALDHPKFAELDDGESWTWVVVWGKASMQSERWRFASLKHAAKVTGRPEQHIRRLIEVGLLDEDEIGVHVHNAPKWQERYPSDEARFEIGDPPTPPERSAKAPRKLREGSVEIEKEIERESKKRDVSVRAPKVLTDEDRAALVAKYRAGFGSAQAVSDDIEQALNHKAMDRAKNLKLYVDGWLRRTLDRRPTQLHTPPATGYVRDISKFDRTGTSLVDGGVTKPRVPPKPIDTATA